MFDTDMQSGLFLDLSDEQQQVVAGGGSTGDALRDKLATYYKANKSLTNLDVAQQSGPEGSTNLQSFKHDTLDISTAAYKDFFAKLG
ncbi:hypothetical protein B7486_25325 [cyanobacterium TDX16]|nr:hypothetical protein B7486_25325 [cyanobacterium TDX16]